MSLQYTPLEDIVKIRESLQKGFASGKLKSVAYRKYLLLQVAYLLKDNDARLAKALGSDLGRPYHESKFMEINTSLVAALGAYKHVEQWAKPFKPAFDVNLTPMRPVVRKEAKGVVLIIAPFNYPLWLIISPLLGAIAAGNAVCIKPSEQTPAISALMTELVEKYLDPAVVRVVNGAIPETAKLLDIQWDHILFTGSGRVGKVVSQAAAKFMTPVTLELGGKSPVFVDSTCDLSTTTRRLLWGKFSNAGQTCTAPDYVLVLRSFQDKFVEALLKTYGSFYPADAPAAQQEPHTMSRMISGRAVERVAALVAKSKGTVVAGGDSNVEDRFFAPTIVKDVPFDDSLMSEELFAPVLPIIPVDTFDEAIAFVNAHDHPLALYVFSKDDAFKAKVFNNTQSGSCLANETLLHSAAEGIPFGGIGASGSGFHSGEWGFNTFSHFRSSLDSPSWLDVLLDFRFPPYTSSQTSKGNLVLGVSLPRRPNGPPAADGSGSGWGTWFGVGTLAVALPALALAKKHDLIKF